MATIKTYFAQAQPILWKEGYQLACWLAVSWLTPYSCYTLLQASGGDPFLRYSSNAAREKSFAIAELRPPIISAADTAIDNATILLLLWNILD